jgi:hypothetical protein
MVANYANVALASVFCIVPTLLGFVLLGGPFGLAASELVAIGFEVCGAGLVVLALIAGWREYARAVRPSWPFIFTLAGGVNVIVWIALTSFAPRDLPQEIVEHYVDLTGFYPQIALVVMLVWSLLGVVFSKITRRPSVGGAKS